MTASGTENRHQKGRGLGMKLSTRSPPSLAPWENRFALGGGGLHGGRASMKPEPRLPSPCTTGAHVTPRDVASPAA
jgi:hypothetical protein